VAIKVITVTLTNIMPYGAVRFSELFLKQFGMYNLSKHYQIDGYNTQFTNANLPPIFPRVEAFLCSEETFHWAVEIYDVEGIGNDLDLTNKSISTFIVKGLNIPSWETKTITIKDNMERGLDYNRSFYPLGVSYYETNNDTPHKLNGERERTVSITGDDLGFPDIEDPGYFSFYRGNNIPHGQLLDMAIYIYD
jgi:hypothetical protein